MYSKYIYTSENSTHFFLKSLPMIVELSSITSYSILDGKLEVRTQNLHVNPFINENKRIFIFLKMLPTSCKTRQHIMIEYFT